MERLITGLESRMVFAIMYRIEVAEAVNKINVLA